MGKSKSKSKPLTPSSIFPLLSPLEALQSLLERFNDQGVIIGGVAASLLGIPRFTVDLDAVILLGMDEIPRLLAEAAQVGIEPRINDALGFARKSRVLLLRHTDSSTDIDISLGVLPFEIEMVERSMVIEIGALKLRLPTPEDLIIMKAVAHRPKDLSDIHSVADSHPGLDKERVRYWLVQFGEALEEPELWDEIERLL